MKNSSKNIFKKCFYFYKLASQDIAVYFDKQAIINAAMEIADGSQQSASKISSRKRELIDNINSYDFSKYKQDIKQYLLRAIDRDDQDKIFHISHYMWNKESGPKNKFNENLSTLRRSISSYLSSLSATTHPFTTKDAENLAKEYIEKLDLNLSNIKVIFLDAISRIKNWNNSSIRIKPNISNIDWEHTPSSFDVYVGGKNIGFTIFTSVEKDNLKVENIDDVIEAGDTDFFSDQNQAQESDYFNLIKEIENPGSTSIEKYKTLYTARPTKDRAFYRKMSDSNQIPAKLFLTSDKNSARGIAIDLAGEDSVRDVWKVIISEQYLQKTLDSGYEKHYQIIGNGFVPIKNMVLIDEGY